MLGLRMLYLACAVHFVQALEPWPPRDKWGSLRDGLHAWEVFKFDNNFTFEVKNSESTTVFKYPSNENALNVGNGDSGFEIIVHGAKDQGKLLKRITNPHVAAILKGMDPGVTNGRTSVSREELLGEGGGLTLLDLLEVTKGASSKDGDHAPHDKWQPVRDAADAWAALNFDVNYAINVGNTKETLFTYTKGSTGMHTRLPGASLSKWPAALMISGLVADGTLSYDDLANKHLKWWATDPKDPRSQITLRHLLTFQSGFMEDRKTRCSYNPFSDFLACAEEFYKNSTSKAKPGTRWSYISTHLQFAGAMAVAATGLSPDKLFEKYLYKPLGMNGTSWSPRKNPDFATGITTTGSDFEAMLRGLLSYEFLGKPILDEMERDWSAPPVYPCGDGWFGHYGMGHWFDCIGYSAGQRAGDAAPLTEHCLKEAIPGGPGAYGYFPLLDRKRGYYFQIVLAEDSKCRSEIPEYLRVIAKPAVDQILADKPLDNDYLLSQMGGLVLRELTDIYNFIPPQCVPYIVI